MKESEINDIIESAVNKTDLPPSDKTSWSYNEIFYNKDTNTGLTFKTLLPGDLYVSNGDGTFRKKDSAEPDYDFWIDNLYNNKSIELKVVGIIRPDPDSEAAMLSGSIGYTSALTEYVIEAAKNTDVAKAQVANPGVDVISGRPFKEAAGKLTDADKRAAFISYVDNLSEKEKIELSILIQCLKAELYGFDTGVPDYVIPSLEVMVEMKKADLLTKLNGAATENDKLAVLMEAFGSSGSGFDMGSMDMSVILESLATLSSEELVAMLSPYIEEGCRAVIYGIVRDALPDDDAIMTALLYTELADTVPDAEIAKYYDRLTEFSETNYEDNLIAVGYLDLNAPSAINIFASSFENKDVIASIIDNYNNSVGEEQRISYTDLVGMLMSSVTIIINAIKYVLIAFVSISLIVSSIMIGVITLISVQERTKEIGVLRAIGASKRDVSSMFNAETIIIGLASGLIGIIITYLLCIPINLILHALTGIPTLSAILPIGAAGLLVLISVLLTLFAGFIPSRSAAKKDPVVALRTE